MKSIRSVFGLLSLLALTTTASASSLPIFHIVKAAIADTSDEAFSIATRAADDQAQVECSDLGYLGKPNDVTAGNQGNAYPVNGGRQWYAEWAADYQCTEVPPVSEFVVIGQGEGRALSSMPAAQSIARSHALADAKNQCRSEFGMIGVPSINSVMTNTTECPGDRYCYATFIAQYNCW